MMTSATFSQFHKLFKVGFFDSGQCHKKFYGRNYIAIGVTQSKLEKYVASGVITAVKSL
jgi:hypothetical protein